MSITLSATNFKSVTRGAPCPVCEGNHKCSRGGDGLILCGRRTGPQPGFVHLGSSKDEIWQLYRRENDPILTERERLRAPPRKTPPRSSVDWQAIVERYCHNLTPALADDLCIRLGLPRVALDMMPAIGHDGEAWTFPEQDGEGRIVGIARRFPDGTKRMMPGSQRGLTIPLRWRQRHTPLFLVEGQSDTLALSLCAVSAIGRPSNTGGIDLLAALLEGMPSNSPIVVLGENDAKSDGQWPGRDGAVRVASSLAERLRRPIAWTLPPDGAKDVRAWILSQKPIPNDLDSWQDIGEALWAV